MGLWDRIVYGVDLDEEQRRGNELDARLEALNRQALETGRWNADQYRRAEENRTAGLTGDVRQDVRSAAAEGAVEGIRAIPGAIKETLRAPFVFAQAILPWQLWVVGAVALFIYLGGGVYLRGILARR